MIKFHRARYGRFLLINTDWLVIDPAGGKSIPFSRVDDRREYHYFVPCFYYGSLPQVEEEAESTPLPMHPSRDPREFIQPKVGPYGPESEEV